MCNGQSRAQTSTPHARIRLRGNAARDEREHRVTSTAHLPPRRIPGFDGHPAHSERGLAASKGCHAGQVVGAFVGSIDCTASGCSSCYGPNWTLGRPIETCITRSMSPAKSFILLAPSFDWSWTTYSLNRQSFPGWTSKPLKPWRHGPDTPDCLPTTRPHSPSMPAISCRTIHTRTGRSRAAPDLSLWLSRCSSNSRPFSYRGTMQRVLPTCCCALLNWMPPARPHIPNSCGSIAMSVKGTTRYVSTST